ncbi:MAG TPA: hypothetical protein VJK52_04795, partial [Candidatus Nanoarchaeia archaeon]|nr:hypothetical protein [Candidatus Nanoarchaeia archaeon]
RSTKCCGEAMASLIADRRGVELSINFLVSIIFAIVLFGLGILFTKNLFSSSAGIVDLTHDQLDAAIEDMFCTNNELVCLNMNAKTLRRGDQQIFGVTILNVQQQADFLLTITAKKHIAPDGTVTELNGASGEPELEIFPDGRAFPLEKNQDERIGFIVRATSGSQRGKYIIDVAVAREGTAYGPVQKLYITVL